MNGNATYLALLEELRELHLEKSSGYGTADDPLANFTSLARLAQKPAFVYPLLRDLEKATRCLSLIEQGRFTELGEEFLDKASLMLCAEALRREEIFPRA